MTQQRYVARFILYSLRFKTHSMSGPPVFGLISCCGSSNTAMDGIFQIFGEESHASPEYMFVVFKNVLLV